MRLIPCLVLTLSACGGSSSDLVEEPGLALLGSGSHDVTARMEKIGGRSDGLDNPTDLAFHPSRPDELWVVNKDDDSTSIFFDVGTPEQRSEHRIDPYALHFMEQVTSIDFGAPGSFGTCQDGMNTYNGQSPGDGFTGPTLWSDDLDIFAQSNPEAVAYLSQGYPYPIDLGSHLDMLHESPQCMGIAWEKHNVYWVFDGFHSSINRYDFHEDHGPGFDDHSDGTIARWVEGEVDRKPGTVSHLAFDHSTSLLYIADTGNNRVAVLDTTTGSRGASLGANEPGTDHHRWKGGVIQTLVDGGLNGLNQPSGLVLHDGVLYVSDHATGFVHAFDTTGAQLDWADTGLGPDAIAGLEMRSANELWLIDSKRNGVYRLAL